MVSRHTRLGVSRQTSHIGGAAYLEKFKMHRRCGCFLPEPAQGTIDAVHAGATVESQDSEVERTFLIIL